MAEIDDIRRQFQAQPGPAPADRPEPTQTQEFQCPSCGGKAYWIAKNGGGTHCLACRKPVRPLVQEIHDPARNTVQQHRWLYFETSRREVLQRDDFRFT